MIEKQISITEFKLQEFINKTLEFNKTVMGEGPNPSFAIVWTNGNSLEVHYEDENIARNNFIEQLNEGKTLFFPYSSSNVDNEVFCANNKTVEIPEQDTAYLIGDVDCFGFSVKQQNDELVISSAIHYGGSCGRPDSIQNSDCDIFENDMIAYLVSFYK